MSTTHTPATRPSQPQQLAFSMPPDKRDIHNHLGDSTTSSARLEAIQEDAYLCAWLRSRLDDALGYRHLREDSALVVTASDRAQVTRLLREAQRRGLDLASGVRTA